MIVNAFIYFLIALTSSCSARWTVEEAQEWEKQHGYLAGMNFIPSTAVNELEMFQEKTFDIETIDRELGFAQKIGFNSARVFLHNLLWDNQDVSALFSRLDKFLDTASSRNTSIVFVLFDSCWNAFPKIGAQPAPITGVHNSQWLQCPGADIINDIDSFQQLQGYVKGIVERYKNDNRISAWDVWNEPNNSGYSDNLISPLLNMAFQWVREVGPIHPLTTPIWTSPERLPYSSFMQLQMKLSDVISFHHYGNADGLVNAIDNIRTYEPSRPIICTEYMARTAGSTFEPHLRIMRNANIFAYNWGLVSGKSQTIYPWANDINNPATVQPTVWFHDVFRDDGSAFNTSEITFISSVLAV